MHSHLFSHVQKVAHRGGSALAPENTLAAFRHALTLSIDALELDVQMSCDGQIVVFHDATVERVTNGQGNLLDLDFAALQVLDAAAHFPGGWPQPERVPTLQEVLDLARQGHVQVYIEIKSSKHGKTVGRYPGIAEAVARDVLAADMLTQVMVMSFDWDILPSLKTLLPGVQTGILVSRESWRAQEADALLTLTERAKALQCEWIHMDARLVTLDMPAYIHAHGLRLGIWTVNDPTHLQRLAQAGVDALTTDRPDFFA